MVIVLFSRTLTTMTGRRRKYSFLDSLKTFILAVLKLVLPDFSRNLCSNPAHSDQRMSTISILKFRYFQIFVIRTVYYFSILFTISFINFIDIPIFVTLISHTPISATGTGKLWEMTDLVRINQVSLSNQKMIKNPTHSLHKLRQ